MWDSIPIRHNHGKGGQNRAEMKDTLLLSNFISNLRHVLGDALTEMLPSTLNCCRAAGIFLF
jgi:hypothetical protein